MGENRDNSSDGGQVMLTGGSSNRQALCHADKPAHSEPSSKLADRKAHLAQLLKQLPNLPGVYKMLGKDGAILYVGKAKSLKARVNSYFAKTIDHPKTRALVARIYDIEIIVARGETEALLLEQNLIKAHRPPYNVVLRDDKSYLYIFVSNDPMPRLAMGRGKRNHVQGRIFGPYPSAHNAKNLILLVQKLFRLRICSNHDFATRKRPCMEYQIKRCSAPCVGMIASEDYQADVKNALRFLSGKQSDVKDALKNKMEAASAALDFEQAAFYRDRLIMISEACARQAVYTQAGEADVMAMAQNAGITCVHVLTVRGGQVLGGNHYFVDELWVKSPDEVFESFILSFYDAVADEVPTELILSKKLSGAAALSAHLGCRIKHNVRHHRREWLDIAAINASNALAAKLVDYQELKARFLALRDVLAGVSDRAISRIECFDISHTMGEAAVGSCVVFDENGARKRDWRQYAIADITAGDDYAAMRQVLTRRYRKHPLPDLLLIDGGKGQLGVAHEVLTALDKLNDTLLVSVAKGEGRKAGLEVLHFVHHAPIDLPMDSKALHLIMHIRDEAHRFAITAHRNKRDKARGKSVLEVIPNLGTKRRRDLLTHFGGMGQLLGASESDIAGVKGIGKGLARTIYKVLHG